MPDLQPCPHLCASGLGIELVLDDYLGIAEAVARCPVCDTHYLLELLDIGGNVRAYRLAPLAAAVATRLIRDLTRGSCDANRAGAEVQAIRVQHPVSRWWLRVMDGDFKSVQLQHAATNLPITPWRELPLDGRRLAESATAS
ncbi:MAG: hypothetical protein H6993_05305 [Pseudomonadales bacterium]|nr:hypothetical protein [Pseudomonadales bacterium]